MLTISIRVLFFSLAVMVFSTKIFPTRAMSASKPPMQQVAVIGASGRLGRQAVAQLLDQGVKCKLLSRHPVSTTTEQPKTLQACESAPQVMAYFASLPGVTIVEGDVTNRESLVELTKDCQACLGLWGSTRRSKISDLFQDYSKVEEDPSHAKQVNYQGVKNLVDACQTNPECSRIVRVTGKGEDPTGVFSVLINMLGSMAKAWNYEGEQVLRASNMAYTIVRPGIMSEDGTPEGSGFILADDGGDLKVAKVSYKDIASLCVDSLKFENAGKCTLTAMTTDDTAVGTSSWDPWLAKAQSDRRDFPADMLQQHYDAVGKVVKRILGGCAGLSAIALAILLKLFLKSA